MWSMRDLPRLPTFLLVLTLSNFDACAAQDLPWPYNLPPHVKYYPEHEALVKRSNDVMQRLQVQQPAVVRKMSSDPGEMFFLDYWSFQGDDGQSPDEYSNITVFRSYEPPTPLHTNKSSSPPQLLERYLRLPVPAAHLFTKRDFSCPSGTNACSSINRPNVCCPSGSTCQIVPNNGLGDVGCCDASQTCAGSLSQCPSGYTGCPNNPGGGCCLPGYACYQEGCVQTSTTTVIVTPTTLSTSSTQPPSTVTDTTTVVVTPTTPSTSSAAPPVSPTTVTQTQTVTTGPTSTSLPTSSQPSSLVCSSGFRSCPASLGGGCCPTDRACGSITCPELTSTATASPPVRGTSSPATTGTDIISGCPGGYYACSAYHVGGCCQVDRDCQSTSCPAKTGVTVVNSGVTIVAPTGTSIGPMTGACAKGWSTCNANVGGGCCPSGYACGTAACTASASGLSATQGKIAPNSAQQSTRRMHYLLICTIEISVGIFLFMN